MVTKSRPPTLFDYITRSRSRTMNTGQPDVSDLPHDLIEQGDQPYMERYFLLGPNSRTPGSQARYHHILTSDLADMHDHPWDFVSVILDGTYIETTPDSEQAYGPGSVLVRKAEQLHRLTLPNGPVWTFVMVGPYKRRWGFATANGWVPYPIYLASGRLPTW